MEIILNDIKTIKDKTAGSVVINKKTYYVCSQCGRLSFRKIKCHKRVWCCKHYKQQKKNGECLDCNPRTYYDRNEIHIIGDTAYIYLYDKDCNISPPVYAMRKMLKRSVIQNGNCRHQGI